MGISCLNIIRNLHPINCKEIPSEESDVLLVGNYWEENPKRLFQVKYFCRVLPYKKNRNLLIYKFNLFWYFYSIKNLNCPLAVIKMGPGIFILLTQLTLLTTFKGPTYCQNKI